MNMLQSTFFFNAFDTDTIADLAIQGFSSIIVQPIKKNCFPKIANLKYRARALKW